MTQKSPLFDHIHDTNTALLWQIFKQKDVPSFVKEAECREVEDIKDLPSRAFADPANRLFPIDTQADTWLSYAYFEKSASTDKNVEHRLKEALTFWGLEEPKDKEQLEKVAAEDTSIDIEFELNGEVIFKTAVSNKEDMEKLAKDVTTNVAKYPYLMRESISRQIIEAGELAPLDMMCELQRTAGLQLVPVEELNRDLKLREVHYRKEDQALSNKVKDLMKEATTNASNGMLTGAPLRKIIAMVDSMDRIANLHNKYSEDLRCPEKMGDGMVAENIKSTEADCVECSDGTPISKLVIIANADKIDKSLKNLGIEKAASLVDTITSLPKEELDYVLDTANLR